MSDAVDILGKDEEGNITAGTTVQSIGPISVSGRYRVTVSGNTVYMRNAMSQADAETLTGPAGAVKGAEVFGDNSDEIMLNKGSYLAFITSAGTATVRLHYIRGF